MRPGTSQAKSIESETQSMALAGVAARIVNAGIVFLTQVLFARSIGAAEFGIYSTANTLMLLVSGMATLGLVIMPQRFWPEYEARGDQARLRGLVRFSSWAPFAIGSVFALVGSVAAWLASGIISPAVATTTCIAMLSVPALASLDVVEGIALARAWKGLAYGVAFVLRPLITPVLFLLAWLAGVTPQATLATASLVGATWLACIVLLVLVHRKAKILLPPGERAYDYRRWIIDGLPVSWINGIFMLMTSADIVLLAVLSDDATVGAYSAAARLVALVAFVHHGLTWASAHHFSALHEAGDVKALAVYAAKMTRWTFLPSLAAALVMILATPLLLKIFGQGFEGASIITILLLLGLLARAAIGPAEQLLIMTDNQKACASAYGWAFLINCGLSLLLIPSLGGAGAALATAMAYGAASLIVARAVHHRLGFPVHFFLMLAPRQAAGIQSLLTARFASAPQEGAEQLDAHAAASNPYAHPIALKAVETSRGNASALVCTNAAGDVLGLWPMRRDRLLRYGPALLTAPLNPLYDVAGSPLITAGREADVLKAMFSALQRETSAPRILRISNLQAEGPLWEALHQLENDGLIALTELEAWERSIFDASLEKALPRSEQGLASEAMLSSTKRKNLRRKRRTLEELGVLTFCVHQDATDVDRAFSAFLTLEASGWKGRQGTALEKHPADERCIRTLLSAMAAAERAFIGELALNGEVIASGLFLRSGGEVFFLKTAYDERFAKQSPGVILDLMLTDWLCSKGWFTRLDSGSDASIDPDSLIWRQRRRVANVIISLEPDASLKADLVVLVLRMRGMAKTLRNRLLKR